MSFWNFCARLLAHCTVAFRRFRRLDDLGKAGILLLGCTFSSFGGLDDPCHVSAAVLRSLCTSSGKKMGGGRGCVFESGKARLC